MFEEFNICPYPGLRSFNEEESIYFKGRDHHVVELIKLLQQNKFLMVTGASGDGKSSLIFGGLIPNARAGFFKAKFNNWRVVHFRPERNPLANISASIADELEVEQASTVETELQRGFSSLVDLYKNSKFYFEEKENDTAIREGANLLIVADQFEEFFTNPENFFRGAPTQEAQSTVHLLLETAKIAKEQDLPVYIVFTMRSDFIGQCAAFRGLPEFIGFSQFFVPRLKRKELVQVIEEPADLSGNRITRRLVERIVYDLEEGVDQLPILQHALNRIWDAADQGKQEMDLIHYAKVGGMKAEDLPEEDISPYNNWLQELPEWKRDLFTNPGLQRVLDIHADELYFSAWEYYNKHNSEHPITSNESQFVSALSFACLTKIDDSRAVRNRMTLSEITNIINKESLETDNVAEIINLYREPGNTFVHPFISEEESNRKLNQDQVLDITHEALIRNWERLKMWASKEFEYFETLQDLKKQLDRWLENDKSDNYLLPIGPLTYFENWYKDCKPNKFWINRYNDSSVDPDENLSDSNTILKNINEYLKRSAKKVIVTKTFMKYGSARIAIFLAMLLVVFLSSFYFLDANRKQNERVLDEISSRSEKLIADPETNPFFKGGFLWNMEIISSGSIFKLTDAIQDQRYKVDALISTYITLTILDKRFQASIKSDLINKISKELKALDDLEIDMSVKLNYHNEFLDLLFVDNYFNSSEFLSEKINKEKAIVYELIKIVLIEGTPLLEVQEFNDAIDHSLNAGLSQVEIIEINKLISPFGSAKAKANFERIYPQESSITFGRAGGIRHNGGYQVIGSLESALGNISYVRMSMDSILKYNSNYFSMFTATNAYNFIGYLYQYNHSQLIDPFIDFIDERREVTKTEIFREILDRSGYLPQFWSEKPFNELYYNLNLGILEEKYVSSLFDKALSHNSSENKNNDAFHYNNAILLKQKEILLYKIRMNRNGDDSENIAEPQFSESIDAYQKISSEYLESEINISHLYWSDGIRRKTKSRSDFYLYPDNHVNGYYTQMYTSDQWVNYIIDNNLLKTMYNSGNLNLFNDWVANYLETFPFSGDLQNYIPLTSQLLLKLKSAISALGEENFDYTLLNLLIANQSFASGQPEKGMQAFNEIDIEQLPVTANRWEYLNFTAIYNEMTNLTFNLTINGEEELAKKVVKALPNPNYKATVNSVVSRRLYKYGDVKNAFVYLDSALQESKKIDDRTLGALDYREFLLETLSSIGGKDLNDMATRIITNMNSFDKPNGIVLYAFRVADEGNYFNAMQTIPEDLSTSDELEAYMYITGVEIQNIINSRPEWAGYNNRFQEFNEYIPFNLNF